MWLCRDEKKKGGGKERKEKKTSALFGGSKVAGKKLRYCFLSLDFPQEKTQFETLRNKSERSLDLQEAMWLSESGSWILSFPTEERSQSALLML